MFSVWHSERINVWVQRLRGAAGSALVVLRDQSEPSAVAAPGGVESG